MSIIADRDDAMVDAAVVEPPSMSVEVLEQAILALTAGLNALCAKPTIKKAA